MSSRPAITLICDICGTSIPIDAKTHKAARIKARDLKWSGSIGKYGRFTDFCDKCCHYNRTHFLEWCETPEGREKTTKFIRKFLAEKD